MVTFQSCTNSLNSKKYEIVTFRSREVRQLHFLNMATESSAGSTKIGQKLAPFNPAGAEVVDIALELLQIKDNDVMYDLGCGDARIVVKVNST